MGVSLFYHWLALREGADERNHWYETPLFSADTVRTAFTRVLNEPEFKLNAMKMRIAAKAQGGRRSAVDIVENAYLHFQ